MLADMALHIEAIVAKPGPDPMRAARARLQNAQADMEHRGFTLSELYRYMYLYVGFTEEETCAERRRYEHAVSLERSSAGKCPPLVGEKARV